MNEGIISNFRKNRETYRVVTEYVKHLDNLIYKLDIATKASDLNNKNSKLSSDTFLLGEEKEYYESSLEFLESLQEKLKK